VNAVQFPYGSIQKKESTTDHPDTGGKTAVITGATSGIGLQSLIALAHQGISVIGVGRDTRRCLAAEEMVKAACPAAQIRYLVADLSRQAEIRRLAENICLSLNDWGKNSLDVLVNNAGIFSDRMMRTVDGVELVLAVNHMAPFLLTHKLLPQILAAPHGRVITVSSASHYHTWINPQRINHPWVYFGLWRYKVSKLANVFFTYELNRRLKTTSVRAFAVDPGLVNTEIGQKGTWGLSSMVWMLRRKSGQSPEIPAHTILFLCTDPTIQDSGNFYWRDCRPKNPSQLAQRADIARQLWDVSCNLCGISRESWEIKT
jgi:retinol dehydrogenase 12